MFFHVFDAGVAHFRHVQQTAFAPELDEHTIRLEGFHFAVVFLSHFGFERNIHDFGISVVNGLLVGAKNGHNTALFVFTDADVGSRLALHFLDNLTPWPDDGTDIIASDAEFNHARRMRFEVRTGIRYGFGHFGEDMYAACAGLQERFFQQFVRHAVDLDVHLRSTNTFIGSCDLEVHVAQSIFIAQNVR